MTHHFMKFPDRGSLRWFCAAMLILACWFLISETAAHHVLGRPAYSLNEDSNTPPSMHVETQIGDYFVSYMVFPAFPKPNQPGRINLYAKRLDNGAPLTGSVTFSVRDDAWFGSAPEVIGEQLPDDSVFRQGFMFKESGDYIITARFNAGGEPYVIDFPLRIGARAAVGPLGLAVGFVLLALVAIKLIKRKRMVRMTIRDAQRERA